MIKTRIARLQGRGIGAARAHIKYLQRDGVTREDEPGKLYDAAAEDVDGKKFLERCDDDRHHFRFIVSPEDGADIEDLKPFVRALMSQMAEDLGTRLDWVAVDHFNTDNPHTHIVLRGKDERGKDLIIARDYISYGFRERAAEQLTIELGPVPDHQIRKALAREVEQDRFTRLDRELIRGARDGIADLRASPRGGEARFRHTLKLGRLRKLEQMGLARQGKPKCWRLSEKLEPTLRAMGARGDIIKTMHREMSLANIDRGHVNYAIFDPAEGKAPIVGQVIARGYSDELNDRHYLIVDGIDGHTHYAGVGELIDPGDYKPGAIVSIEAKLIEPRQVDQTIAEISKHNGGIYNEDLHHQHDPRGTKEFVRAHVRRLEAMRRQNLVRRFQDGSWEIPNQFLQNAQRFDEKDQARQPVRFTLLSHFSLGEMAEAEGATWLDHQLVGRTPEPAHASGFGGEVKKVLERRQQWLMSQGLAQAEGGRAIYAPDLIDQLRARDLRNAGARLSIQTGLQFMEHSDGERIEGIYKRPVHLASGKYAIVERSKEFTLVPWRDILEKNQGKSVSGIMRSGKVFWNFSRNQGIGIG